jgi:hypothetical protein
MKLAQAIDSSQNILRSDMDLVRDRTVSPAEERSYAETMLCDGPGVEELGSRGSTCVFPEVGWSDLKSILFRGLGAVGVGTRGVRGLTGIGLGGESFNMVGEERGLSMMVV